MGHLFNKYGESFNVTFLGALHMVSLVAFTPNQAILVYIDILFESDLPLYLWDSNMYRNKKDTSLNI